MASLDIAVCLVTQAVKQDSAKNYEEAARCYREALNHFRSVAQSDKVGKKVKSAIEEKCLLYENRLRKLDRHLLSKADLSKLFRDCVASELRNSRSGESLNKIEEELESSSVDSVELYENPFLKRGLQTIDKAKKEDSLCHFPEALHFYEQGAGLLLDAIRKNRVPEQQADCIRIKCLLLHDRCEVIRNHLERGSPLKLRKESLNSFENSLEGSQSESGSPIPTFEEEKTLLMDEVRSVKAGTAGSTHSLYPTCVEIRRSESVMSGHSDFATSTPNLASTPSANDVEEQKPMLAYIDAELKISETSLQSTGSNRISSRSSRSKKISVEELNHLQKSTSMGSLGREFSDSLLVLDKDGKMSCLSLDQRDRNISELSYVNTEIDPELYNISGNKSNQDGSHVGADSGSDSGFSDPIQDSDSRSSKSPSSAAALDLSAASKSPDSDIDSIDIVPSLPQTQPSPTLDFHDKKQIYGSPTPSAKSSLTRRSSRKSGSNVRISPTEELVTVLSEETVVNGKPVVSPEVYVRASEKAQARPEYVPPRALAPLREEEDDINKGCYYFMACLDSFWIL